MTGATLGVEEEFHVARAGDLRLHDDPVLNRAALAGRLGERVSAEIATTQLETATAVCTTLDEVRAELLAARAQASAAAASAGAVLLAASTHPLGCWHEQRLTSRPRYLELLEKWGLLALQQVICGCHVHVGVPDLEVAVAVMDRVRPHLPLLLALTGSSAFHEGSDTGYDSYRTQWFARWPITGPPEEMGSAEQYLTVVQALRTAGVVEDSSNLYWDVRPSLKYPTLEFRVADVCTDVDDAVLHAALVRSLTRVLAGRARAGWPVPPVRPEVLRAARWRAARFGLGGDLLDPVTLDLVPAPEAARRLLAELEGDLREHGEHGTVRDLLESLLARGTSATRQRAVLHRTGDLHRVAEWLVRCGTGESR